MPTSLAGLIPLHATVRTAFNNPCGNVTSLFKKPWIQPPRPGNPAFPTGAPLSRRRHPPSLSPTSASVSLTGPRTSSPLPVHGYLTRQPSLRVPPYPTVLSTQACPSLPPGLAFAQQFNTVLLGLLTYCPELLSHQARVPSSLCQLGCTQKHVCSRS